MRRSFGGQQLGSGGGRRSFGGGRGGFRSDAYRSDGYRSDSTTSYRSDSYRPPADYRSTAALPGPRPNSSALSAGRPAWSPAGRGGPTAEAGGFTFATGGGGYSQQSQTQSESQAASLSQTSSQSSSPTSALCVPSSLPPGPRAPSLTAAAAVPGTRRSTS